MKIDVLIAHAAWDERRAAAAKRLATAIGGAAIVESREKEHANVWARRVWSWGNSIDATLFLNDDVIPHPDLLRHVEQLVTLLPGEVISLHCQFDAVRTHALAGKRLARCYWPSGPAYVLQGNDPADLLSFVASLPPGFFAGPMNEDGIIANWLWRRQRPAYCTIPALVRHDTSIPSTLGYDLHPGRKSPVDWDKFPVREWTKEDVETAPYIPTPWMHDEQYRQLGDALRGLVPLCGFCFCAPATFTNDARKVGVCYGCGTEIARARVRMGPGVTNG